MSKWDIDGFIKRLQGGFDSGEQKRTDEEKLVQQQQKEQEKLQQQEDKVTKQDDDEARKSELHQLKVQKEQLNLTEKIMKLFGNQNVADSSASPAPMLDPKGTPPEPNYGKGNIDLNNRPIVYDESGKVMTSKTTVPGDWSTLHSVSFNIDGKEVLIPRVREGLDRLMTNQEALDWYKKTGEYLGKFDTEKESTDYALKLHEDQAKQYTPSALTPTPNTIIEALKKGFEAYSLKSGYDNPLATMSAEMAKAGEQNPLPDPYLPATMNLMETGGSKNMASENNYFNYGSNPKPDAQTAIDRVYQGIGNTGEGALYADYLKTGNIGDFFKRYTPSSDPRNPDQQTLIDTYNSLRRYFPSTK